MPSNHCALAEGETPSGQLARADALLAANLQWRLDWTGCMWSDSAGLSTTGVGSNCEACSAGNCGACLTDEACEAAGDCVVRAATPGAPAVGGWAKGGGK